VLFEQHKTVQDVFKRRLPKVVSWLSIELCSLQKVPPAAMAPSQTQCIYALVKVKQLCLRYVTAKCSVNKGSLEVGFFWYPCIP